MNEPQPKHPTKQHVLDELERLSKRHAIAMPLLIRKVRRDCDFAMDAESWREDLAESVADLAALRDQYADMAQALVSSHWGCENLEELVATHGNAWKRHLPRATAEYLQAVMP